MKVGDYVLCHGGAWKVIRKHEKGSYQIKTVCPLHNFWDNIEVVPEDVTVITKEVADILIAVNNQSLPVTNTNERENQNGII
jgi:hypothetical protein